MDATWFIQKIFQLYVSLKMMEIGELEIISLIFFYISQF